MHGPEGVRFYTVKNNNFEWPSGVNLVKIYSTTMSKSTQEINEQDIFNRSWSNR